MYKAVIDILQASKEAITRLLTSKDDEHHLLRLQHNIDRDIDYLSLMTRTGDILPRPVDKLGPATTIGGKSIDKALAVSREDLKPNEEKLKVLRMKVESAYDAFLSIESLDILRNYEENVIRGVAKKAKMKVTKEDPETIDLAFIEEIKSNIIELAQHELRRQAGKSDQVAEVKDKITPAIAGSGFSKLEKVPDTNVGDIQTGTTVQENDTNIGDSETKGPETETKQQEFEIKSNPDAAPHPDQSIEIKTGEDAGAGKEDARESETELKTAQEENEAGNASAPENNVNPPAPEKPVQLEGESNTKYKKRLAEWNAKQSTPGN